MSGIIPENKKRPRWLWLMGALFLSAAILLIMRNYAGEGVDPLTVEERAWLKAHPVIRFAPDPDFPPVEYFDKSGGYNGITKDYLALIEKKLGIRIEIVRLRNWDEIISKAKSRQIDAYVATKTPQRTEYLLFTRPFLEFPVVIIAREKVKGPLTLEKLNGMRVSVVSDYAAHNFIAYNYPKLHLDLTPDVQTGLRKVAFGLCDAFVENLATTTYYIEKQGITNLRIAGESGYFYRMGLCTRKDWPELNRILEKGLAAISADEKKAIYKKWVPVEPRSLLASKEFQIAVLAAFGAAALIITAILAWNRALSRQVGRRTEELEKELAERKRMEEELERSNAELEKRVEERTAELTKTVNELLLSRFCIDKAAIGIYHTTFEGNILSANDFACQSLDYTGEELRALKVSDIDPAITSEKILEIKRMLDDTGSATHETVHRRKDGTTFPVEITANNLEFQGKSYTFSFVKDITERKRAEESLRKSELTQRNLACVLAQKNNFLRTLIDAIPDLIFYKDCNMVYLGCNRAFEAFTGRPEKDLVGRTDLDIFNREVAVLFREKDRQILSSEVSQRNEEWIDYPDGRRVLLETLKTPYFDLDGEVLGVVGISRDITERKRMEEELRENKEKYQAIIDAIDGHIYIASRDNRIQFMNTRLSKLTGYLEPGEYCFKVMHDRNSACPGCSADAVFEGKMAHREWFSPTDGRWYHVVYTPIFHADGSISRQAMATDITERKLAEEQLKQQKQQLEELNSNLEQRVQEEVAKNREKDIMLIQQNRQAALGELLDHIAHQWKQPLNSISLIIQNLWETYAYSELTADKINETIDKTMALLGHMAQTIEVFRDFYRPDKEKTVFYINDSVDKALAFISPALKYQSIAVELDVDPELLATGYPKEYTQVLLNILSNARDAFRERNTGKPKVNIRAFAEGNKAVVTITDNAGGIPKAIIHRIFDLYITTKEASGGTGIGLHMSKNIIEKNMGGTLTAENADCGAQFRIVVNMPEYKGL